MARARLLESPALVAATTDNRAQRAFILAAATLSTLLYGLLAVAGDLRERPALFGISFAVLLVLMTATWQVARRVDAVAWRFVIVAALVFRLAAAWGEPALSDDVYRLVWDGRVQLAGHHPYAYAPLDAELAPLRDDEVWPRINHPELRTIYPPLAQAFFLLLAAVGAGPAGFRLALGLIDFAVVLALAALLRRSGVPRERLLLYAWNPLAVLETAGSGHVEPLGVLLVLLALRLLLDTRESGSAACLGGAVQVKLVPLFLAPALLRRLRPAHVLVALTVVLALWLPYALTGPAVGSGLFAYAERWEFNASAYSLVQGTIEWLQPTPLLKDWVARVQARFDAPQELWDFLYRHVWPRDLARLAVGLLAVSWVLALALRRRTDVVRESLLAISGVLLLSPTVHPWYVLWVLPLAVVRLDWGWLGFAALVPLAYASRGGDVAPWLRAIEYAPLVAWLGWRGLVLRRRA